MNKKSIDFLVIGAQKSGTTTLFHLLRKCEDLVLPSGKEVPFLLDDNAMAKGLEYNLSDLFGEVGEHLLKGTVTPQYMNDPRAAEIICQNMPDVKLIAILRNPVERAYSHYQMSVRRGLEKRSFMDAINHLMLPDNAKMARELPTGRKSEDSTYLVWGEYGRMLGKYSQYFDKKNILVLFMDDLESSPQDVLNKITEFLDVRSTCFENSDEVTVYNQGGGGGFISIARKLKYIPFMKYFWRLLGQNTRSAIYMRLNEVKIGGKAELKSSSVYDFDPMFVSKLYDYYEDDLKFLSKEFSITVPSWAKSWRKIK
jgi:hypothetical protein